MMRAAVLTPAPDFAEDWNWAFDVQAAALREAGIAVEPLAWTEARDLDRFDAVLPLVTWGYHLRFQDWLALLDQLEAPGAPRSINSPALLRWSSDKSYLEELAASGIATVPSRTVAALDQAALEQAHADFGDELVVKPLVSAAADGTYRLGPADAFPDAVRGQRMLIQPFMPSIAATGEYSLILFAGEFSHAIVKRPKPGDFRVQPHLGGSDAPCDPPPGAIALACAALDAAPAPATYARVDMIADEQGQLRIMELELVEPALFLHHAPDGGQAFGAAMKAAMTA
ncbi:MAG TPA: hypothetical protein VNJ10_03350 [Sphingomonas sp.]|nr:hypothetical protein [Sphingomonas sp.]